MKRSVMLLALVGGFMIPAAVGQATPPLSAAEFAADCADGPVEVSGTQLYVGGTATMDSVCQVVIAADSTLILKNLTLTGRGLVIAASAPNTTIEVINSSLQFDEFLELTAGCCAGDSEVPENDGTVVIRGSDLKAQAIYINTSFDWPDGQITIRGSRLESTTTNAALGVTVRSSDLGGSDGSITVAGSEIISQTYAEIATGVDGRTVVRNNVFDVADVTNVSTGVGGVCIAKHNTPTVTCS